MGVSEEEIRAAARALSRQEGSPPGADLAAIAAELTPWLAELPARWEAPGLPAGLKRELVRHLIDHVPVVIIAGPRHRIGQVGAVVWQDWVAELG